MKLPHTLGVTSQLRDRTRRLIERLEGDGYAKGEDTVRGQLITVWALAAAFGASAAERSLREAFVSQAVETLRSWELEHRLPNDASRTPEERQRRLLLHSRIRGFSDGAVRSMVGTVADVVDLLSTSGEIAESEGAEWWTASNVAVLIDAASFDDARVRSEVVEVLRRSVPVRSYGHHTIPEPSALVAKTAGVKWSDANYVPGATVLRSALQDPAIDYPYDPSRIVSYGPLTAVRPQDLKRIQDALLIRDASGPSVSFLGQGGKRVFVSAAVGASATLTVDTSIDWRDRYVFGVTARNAFDIRPGQASDSFLNSSLGRSFVAITGAGGASFSWDVDGGGVIDFFVNGSGELQLINSTGSTVHVVAMLMASEQLGKDGGTVVDKSLPWESFGAPETFADVPASYGEDLFNAVLWTEATEIGSFTPGSDGLSRFGFVATERSNTFTIDERIDWRDRLLFVVATLRDDTGADKSTFPGGGDDSDFNSDDGESRIFLAYLGSGGASYQASLFETPGVDLYLQANASGIGLNIAHDAGSSFDRASVSLMIYATPKLGNVGNVSTFTPSPTDGSEIAPSELNAPQDIGLMSPFFATANADTIAVGAIAKGDPPLCYDTRREGIRTWRRPDAWPNGVPSTTDAPLRYQIPIVGGLIRFFAETIASGVIGRIDDVNLGGDDWRDRVIHLSLVLDSAGDQTYPGGSNDTAHNGTTSVEVSFYSGPGIAPQFGPTSYEVQLASNLEVFVSEVDGSLQVANGTLSQVTISGVAYGSPVIGPRYPIGG